jgi:hypothetical protein
MKLKQREDVLKHFLALAEKLLMWSIILIMLSIPILALWIFGIVSLSIFIFTLACGLCGTAMAIAMLIIIDRNYESHFYEYGTCNKIPARRHKLKGNVQFVLWKAGEQGHKKDYWHDFDSSWRSYFKPNEQ